MSKQTSKVFTRSSLVLLLIVVASVSARATHFGDTSQGNQQEQDGVNNNLIDSGLTPLQLEMIAQRLSEYNQVPQIPAAWDRFPHNPEVKRQSRYRQCYFNPISCFKK